VGEKHILQNPVNANKIRALLLAAIRSTVLWRQKGGKRWHFLWSRNKILRTAKQLIAQIET
jgi:high frequency lysogenization protein